MQTLQLTARETSRHLGFTKGNFINKYNSIFKDEPYMRNAAINCIPPTGSTSMIVDGITNGSFIISSGIEPNFGWIIERKSTTESYKNFKYIVSALNDISDDILEYVSKNNTFKGISKVIKSFTPELEEVYKTSNELSYIDHLNVLEAAQKYVDNGISKTINMHSTSTVEDIIDCGILAWKKNIKGFTIYVDKSRDIQVLNNGISKDKNGAICTEKICISCDKI